MAQPLRQREAHRAAGDADEPRGGRGARAPGLGPRDAGASPESRPPNPERRPNPHHRSCGASRPEHDGLAVRAYCDVVPRGCGRHARRAPQGAERRARRERQEDLVHASDRSEEHTSELQSRLHLVCRLLLEKKKNNNNSSLTVESYNYHELYLEYVNLNFCDTSNMNRC